MSLNKTHFEHFLTPELSEFEILHDATLIIQNWRLSTFFSTFFHHPNFIEENKLEVKI